MYTPKRQLNYTCQFITCGKSHGKTQVLFSVQDEHAILSV